MRPKTKREIEIERLDSQIIDFQQARLRKRQAQCEPGGADLIGHEAERFFRRWARSRHPVHVNRGGWPDFFLIDQQTGKVYCVEVKSKSDTLSKNQARCFSMLEKAGIPVFVWQPHRPSKLMPWRRWHTDVGLVWRRESSTEVDD